MPDQSYLSSSMQEQSTPNEIACILVPIHINDNPYERAYLLDYTGYVIAISLFTIPNKQI